MDTIAYHMRDAVNNGYGLVITTGGVGAEDKDFTIEALISVDPDAQTPYLVRFHKGQGRHVKHGVRIGVGKVGLTTIVCLPGPNQEVRMGLDIVIKALANGWEKDQLAQEMVNNLRENVYHQLQINSEEEKKCSGIRM